MKQIGQSPSMGLRLESKPSLSLEPETEVETGSGAAAKMSSSSCERKASWYCRSSGAFRTLWSTFRMIKLAIHYDKSSYKPGAPLQSYERRPLDGV